MNRKIRNMKKRLERAGATVFVSEDIPTDLAEQFLESLLECPDCAAELNEMNLDPAVRRRRPPHDH